MFTSSLRGLTHVLTCSDEVATPFTMIIPPEGPPQVVSSTRIERGGEETLCGGLDVDLRARGSGEASVEMIVSITNNTDSIWQGSVNLALEGARSTSIPVSIGSIPAGGTGSDTVEFSLNEGTHEVAGSLLIGP